MSDQIQDRIALALGVQGPSKVFRTHKGFALGTSLGLVRKLNEDRCMVVRGSYAADNREGFTAAIVCDGLGGMSQGREAAVLAASAFAAHLYHSTTRSWEERILGAITSTNHKVYQQLEGNGGTTLSAIIIPERGDPMLCHVGDSRIYALSPERALEQLSRDDTINAALNKRDGNPEVPKDSRLLQFVGMGSEMEAQIAHVPNQVKSILLTSDGAHDIPASVLQRLVKAAAGGNDLVRKLLELSDMLGGHDNASAILLPLTGTTDFYPINAENELLAILPTETLSICLAYPEAFGQPHRVDLRRMAESAPPSASPREAASPITSNDKVANQVAPEQPKSKGKPGPRKSKRRTRKKSEPDARLPLDEPRPEVDVQFSSPSSTTDEQDKE